jgi:hypothetical protein
MIDSGGVFEMEMDTGLVSEMEGNAIPEAEGELRS